ncbi:Hypothetical protein R9X50_00508500 [Acrodontium crateriforme]|uniref:Nucleoprotein TPR/MLP1 domain-containing protein n=1 Tax=Acrodontium crateriforme TaxID=150365 RepID=A0AAQ3M6H0_9PEZI|nr:Hypothetical protein R9X50_00508500 [Acrodontium crateriforme]
MRTRGQQAATLDVAYLSACYGIPESEFQTLLDEPTSELVESFLATLITKGQEFDGLRAEKLKLDVELENIVRTTDAKVKAQKAAVARHAKESAELKAQLTEVEQAREKLASEVDELRSSTSGSSAETGALRQRIEELQASNRDTLALVESKSAEKDRIALELSEQHNKLLGLRREIGQLEERNQSLESAASAHKFKEQSLQQEIDLLKRNNDWHANELRTKGEEHAKFRKERNARIASLQRELEDASTAVETAKRAENTLRERLEEIQTKADEAFARNASLQEEITRKEQNFQTELASSKRLADLHSQSASTHKARLQEVQSQVEQIKDDAAEEIGRLQAEVETERADKDTAERKIAELELNIERLEQQPRASRPGTPMRNGDFDPVTPIRLGSRAGSPMAMPGTLRKSIGGLSFTQLYSNYTELQQELEAERRRTARLSTAMDELVSDLETQSPEIVELKSEQERLEAQILDFSRMLDDTKEVRDKAVQESEHWQTQAEASLREGEILRQQLRDLSTQVKILMVELQSQNHGLGEMSSQERFELERAARGELEEGALEHMTATGRLISERLVIFRNVNELQAQNEHLLRITRELGDKMEGEEAREQARKSAADAQENEELKQQLTRYKDELTATAAQIDTYMKERDMFRRMLQHRGQLAPDADLSMFGQSFMPATPQRNGSMPPATPRSKDLEDLNKILKEQQIQFDQYRTESTTDRRTLQDQVDNLAREKSLIQAENSRVKSELDRAVHRYEMLDMNFKASRKENEELQRRSEDLRKEAEKLDIKIQQITDDLTESNMREETSRHKISTLNSEKELLKSIESRLSEDVKNFRDDANRLNKLVADMQHAQNERTLMEEENRRRLQIRADTLESDLAEAKRKLDAELDESRKSSLRREFEESQNRTRIDDLVKSLGNVREELIAAKTTRDQLQARVDEMKIDLRAAEEKVNALQPRQTPRHDDGNANGETDELSQEQRLALEVSELHRDLEIARNDLESARQQVEQYKQIAHDSEVELATSTEITETYKQETDLTIEEKDKRIQELQQKCDDISQELERTNSELSELRTKADDNSRALNEQKATFESQIALLRDGSERHAAEVTLYQADLKAQAEIAQQAQQSYEDELLKHAEAAKSLQNVRKEFNELRTQVAGIRAEAEASKASLENGEESWAEQRSRFESEIQEAMRRREDVDRQNKLLHEQMEGFSAELAALRASRSNTTSGNESGAASSSVGDGNSLQEVIKFLRREKEIVDVQYELSIQEAKRLQQQLDYTQSQLEESRQKLAEERSQANEKAANQGNTDKLMQTLNELNLYRESSATLRNEGREAREKLEQKSKEVERLLAELEPIKGRVYELESEIENKEGEMKLLQNDRDHWRERTQNIISKYDRVDPAELEALKTQLEELKAEKERLEAEQVPLKEQVETFETRINEAKEEVTTNMTDRLQRFKDQAKEQNRKQNEKIRAQFTEIEQAKSELQEANNALEEAKAAAGGNNAEVDALKSELEQAKNALIEAQQSKPTDDEEEGQIREQGSHSEDHAELHARIAAAETAASEHAARAETLQGEVQTLQTRIQELESQVSNLEQQLASAQDGSETPAPAMVPVADTEALEKLKQELSVAQQEIETLRAGAMSPVGGSGEAPAQPAEGERSVADQVAEEVSKLRTELEEQHVLALKQVEDERDRKIDTMKKNIVRQLREEREKMRSVVEQELAEKHASELQKLNEDHEALVAQLKQEHQTQLDKLIKDGNAAVQKVTEKTSTGDRPEITEEHMLELVKTNQRMKGIVRNNIVKGVAVETEKLNKTIAEKDAEIAALQAAQSAAPSTGADQSDLAAQLEAAKKDKEAAVKQAIENAEKKTKVQLSQRDLLQARIAVVRNAAKETPEKPVAEVWLIAEKAKPVPKANPAAAQTTMSASVPPTPVQAPVQAPAQTPVPVQQTPEQIEAAKLAKRQERFGIAAAPIPAATGIPTGGSFGQPSAPLQSGLRRPTSALSTNSPNPEAPTFAPRSGLPHPRGGGSGLPVARGGFQGGAARGSGIARGNFRGGRGGAAGQKRAHEGGDGGNDIKRAK